jgi:formate dehydrogenase subunit gamma
VSTTTAGTHPTWSDDRAADLTRSLAGRPGPLLEVLHALQHEFGYLDPRAVPVVADVLNLSRAEVHGVISFYTDFRTTPPAASSVQVCRGEACQAVGAEALAAHASRTLGCEVGGTSSDGRTELHQVFCFGNCALGPTVTVDGRLHGRVTAERLDGLLDAEGAR